MEKIRTRFAPSPTGPQHIGGIRTALYNYLIAKREGGDFILRIEDTDSSRYVPGSEEYILRALRWAGIKPTEGIEVSEGGEWKIAETVSSQNPNAPYRQSQRRSIYKDYVEKLIDSGHAYYAFDQPEFLDKLRKEAEKRGDKFSYGPATRMSLNNSLSMTPEEVERNLKESESWVIRFKLPDLDRELEIHDKIRGKIKVHTSTLDDKVLWKKSDELPTYHLANIVDDHLMDITDVIRGEEWLPSLPLHILLYQAFGWTPPRFAHLPLLLKPEGMGTGKLSKRDGDLGGFPVFPISWKSKTINVSGYDEAGYVPEAFVNFLAYLGWNPGDNKEIRSMEELIHDFSLSRCQKAGAKFNPKKAIWYNHEYLQAMTPYKLREFLRPYFKAAGYSLRLVDFIRITDFLSPRLSLPADLWTQGKVFFEEPDGIRLKDWNSYEEYIPMALELAGIIISSSSMVPVKDLVEGFVLGNFSDGWKSGVKVLNCLRMIISGSPQGPDLPQTIEILGRKTLNNRIEKFKFAYGYRNF